MLCARCDKQISGAVVKALGEAWHPQCLVCEHCKKPLAEEAQFTQHEGKLYHPNCYTQALAPKCDLCLQPFAGEYVIDAWGNKVHPQHFKQVPTCFSCQRLTHPNISGKPMQYKDGRVVCGICRKTAVIAQQSAETIFEEAEAWFNQILPFRSTPLFPIRTADQNKIKEYTKRDRRQTAGVTRTLLTRIGDKEEREVKGIYILSGLPRLHFLAVSVHELMHAWLFLEEISPLPARVEEGLCVLMEELFLKDFKTDEAAFYRKQIKESKDPVYGGGFRDAHEAYQKLGLQKLLRHVARKKKFPGGLFSFF